MPTPQPWLSFANLPKADVDFLQARSAVIGLEDTSGMARLIQQIIKSKAGSKEFALFYMLDGKPAWQAMLGNELPVPLGESRGEFIGSGKSLGEAVGCLRSNLISGTLNEDYDWLLALHRTPWLQDFAEGREYDWDDEEKMFNDLMIFMRSKIDKRP